MEIPTSYRIVSIGDIKKAICREMDERGYPTLYCLSPFSVPFSRVHVLGFVVNTYMREDEKYGFLVIDDGTEEIRVKMFSDAHVIRSISKGSLVDIAGRVREYEGERYIVPDKIKVVEDINILALRKLEIIRLREKFKRIKEMIKGMIDEEKRNALEKEFLLTKNDIELLIREEEQKEQHQDLGVIKKEILDYLREKDKGEGVEYVEIIKVLSYPEDVVEKAIGELMAEGTCYEPKAGRMKILD